MKRFEGRWCVRRAAVREVTSAAEEPRPVLCASLRVCGYRAKRPCCWAAAPGVVSGRE